jgi:hypothetical protein
MDANFETGTRSKSIQSLPQALLSLIGSNKNLNSGWIKSVSDIINDLKSTKNIGYPSLKEEAQEKMERLTNDDGEIESSASKIQGHNEF